METESQWEWPSFMAGETVTATHDPTENASTAAAEDSSQFPASKSAKYRQYGSRTCRICLDTEDPKFPTGVTTALGLAATSSKPTYVSDDPTLGRLLSPCKCKGTQKYVHEGCLNAWRQSSPAGTQNFWQCPTCHYSYKLARLRYASLLQSRLTRAGLTLVIFGFCLFLLGFIADPIFNIWLDPVGIIEDTVLGGVGDLDKMAEPLYEPSGSWSEHFIKGLFSLGVVGLVKSMLIMSPWDLLGFRASGLAGGGRRRNNGRGRVENISIVLVVLGAFAALRAIWKGVRALSSRMLQSVCDRVIDVGEDGPDFEDETDASKKSSGNEAPS